MLSAQPFVQEGFYPRNPALLPGETARPPSNSFLSSQQPFCTNMKKLFYLLLFLLPAMAEAQTTEYGSFKILNTEIIYQRVFTADSVTLQKLADYLSGAQNVTNVSTANGVLTADLGELVVDFKKFQFTQVATPPIIQTGKFSGKISAETKDGRYRITVNKLVMKGDIGYKKIPSDEPVTNYACVNSGTLISREWCKPTMLGLLDKAFTDRFTWLPPKSGSDW
jgi:hypothetical protein